MSKKPPAFQMYAADFFMDTIGWTNEEVGAYVRLLLYSWVNGPLPNDMKELANIAQSGAKKFANNWKKLQTKFTPMSKGKYINLRLEETRDEQVAWREKSKVGGKRSARMREARKKGTHTDAEWIALVEMANYKCPRCKRKVVHFDKDHVMPVYQGGSDSIQNIQPLCAKCNSQKGPKNTDHFKKQRAVALRELQPPLEPPLQPKANPSSSSSPSPSSKLDTNVSNMGEVSKPNPQCPHEKIIELYHKTLPMCPQVRTWPDHLKSILRSRWKTKNQDSIEFWERFFVYVSHSKWLTGQVRDWCANLEWLIRPTNFTKISNGSYHQNMNKTYKSMEGWIDAQR
ncbi:MAG TPA: DUF1376 domain-containing protein [Desulfobacterales bacterium]|nr:DUF1376 domain-containing protein [Desulfobacterales bacterium]